MIKNLSKKSLIFLISVAFFVSLTLYYSSLDYYFFQDDFFEINISKAQNFSQYLDFFKFRDDIIAYRPISLQHYFFVSTKIFGLDPSGFRLITFIFFFSSAVLIIQVIKKITQNLNIGVLCASLWLLSSIHFMSLTWIAAAYNIIGTFFWLLTSLFFLKYQEKPKLFFYVLALIAFLLTIGSFEFSVTWPIIFGFYYFYVLKNSLLRSLRFFSPFIAFTIIYLMLRLLLIKVPQIPEYYLAFNLESIKALFWYSLFSFNIPEEFKKQVATSLLVFRWKFISEYWPLVLKSFLGALIILTISVFMPIYNILKRGLKASLALILFALVWFTVGIFPVLLLPNHTFAMYLTLPAIGIYLLIAYLFVGFGVKLLVIPLLIIWLFTSATTLSFYKTNSWMVEAQRISFEFASRAKRQFPTLPHGSVIFYPTGDTRHIQALMQDHAVKAIYNDDSLSVYYDKKTLMGDLAKGGYNKLVYVYQSQ